ncbi:hypothetical protein E1301_Tti022841 [Triplophysa tibetana]|uniref:Uncharacterized protein n=1 Tax=Triplophysa tibetana TaxID=1572043 RepID=A0A5A9NU37_9TELE|nr:hypothetical protein E1301_Tti022841 [Triplophysa tibetana]
MFNGKWRCIFSPPVCSASSRCKPRWSCSSASPHRQRRRSAFLNTTQNHTCVIIRVYQSEHWSWTYREIAVCLVSRVGDIIVSHIRSMIHWAGRIEKELEKVLQLVTGVRQMKAQVWCRSDLSSSSSSSSSSSVVTPHGTVSFCLTFDLCSVQIYSEKRSQFDVVKNTPKQLVDTVARDIARLLHRKRKALEVRALHHT